MTYTSKMDIEKDWKYPQPKLVKEGNLSVSEHPPHTIAWQEYGNPKGEPVMFLHGGPGGGCAPFLARFFDPERYRIILLDQRGCGKSRPSAADNNPLPALENNTTGHLIGDMDALRSELGIRGKMHLFGGSWGSTLALAYAIEHPENVESMVLRGIFLCRKQDLDYFYQGNAATYEKNPNDHSVPGAYLMYPEAWKRFVEIIPPEKRGDMIKAYAAIFSHIPANDVEHARLTEAAKAWSVWEGVSSYLSQDLSDLGKFEEPEFAKAFARIENHYFMNGAFLGGKSGEPNRSNNYILEHADRIKDIPIRIVHGRADQVCPLFQAEELVEALKKADAKDMQYTITPAGHSMLELENCLALTRAMDELPRMRQIAPTPLTERAERPSGPRSVS